MDGNQQAAGADFFNVDDKGNKKPIVLVADKLLRVKRVEEFTAGNGDAELRRQGKDPAKLSFQQKYYELLGGDAKIEELKRLNLNPFDGPRLDYRIQELELAKQYHDLGGDEEYVRLGCPQNKEITLDNRVSYIKSKRKLH